MHEALVKYLDCKACKLHRYRRHVVLGRGFIPARVLFIGEAPGPSEDLLGEAFVGRAGRLLNEGMAQAAKFARRKIPPFFITNILGCQPCDARGGHFRVPDGDEIVSCRPRLRKTIELTRSEKIVLLGKVAQREAKSFCPDALELVHPAYFLRLGGAASPQFKTFVRELSALFASLKPSKKIIGRNRRCVS